MPELPEVEVVRRGLAPALCGARVCGVEVRDQRALKRHRAAGAADPRADFVRQLTGASVSQLYRRGKFLWAPLLGTDTALLMHLGMSGQLLLRAAALPDDRHVRVRIWVQHARHGKLRVDFADQRLFGSLAIDALTGADDATGQSEHVERVPTQITHIARDLLDARFDEQRFVDRLRVRRSGVKRALLDQGLVSGIGNIYADESLWCARLHPDTPTRLLSARAVHELLRAVRRVFALALEAGGTSFDAQYVNVNGDAGYFSRYLRAYGREGEPCERCGQPIVRVKFMNRSSFYCPVCQALPG